MRGIENDHHWHAIFERWPADLPRQGIITTAQESFGFSDFLISQELLLAERDRPDAIGSRKIFVPFTAILALKLTDPGSLAPYKQFGFNSPG
jgi:hypothetical protein